MLRTDNKFKKSIKESAADFQFHYTVVGKHMWYDLSLLKSINLFVTEYGRIPWQLRGKESTCKVGDMGQIPGSGRSSGEGKGSPLQSSCLGNPIDRGAC